MWDWKGRWGLMLMNVWIALTVQSLLYGNGLALAAAALALTYAVTRVPNFVHGDYVTFGVLATILVAYGLGLGYGLGLASAFVLGGLLALACYVFVLKPMKARGADIVTLMISTFALTFVVRYCMYMLTDYLDFINLGGISPWVNAAMQISGTAALFTVTVLPIAMIVALHLLLTKTRLGWAMRAIADNEELAKIVGINVEKILIITWFLIGGYAAIAGVVWSIAMGSSYGVSRIVQLYNLEWGWLILLEVFAACILGGVSSIYGSIVAAYILAFARVMGTYIMSTYFGISSSFAPAIPLVILIVVLLLMPEGIAGFKWSKILSRIGLKRIQGNEG